MFCLRKMTKKLLLPLCMPILDVFTMTIFITDTKFNSINPKIYLENLKFGNYKKNKKMMQVCIKEQ